MSRNQPKPINDSVSIPGERIVAARSLRLFLSTSTTQQRVLFKGVHQRPKYGGDFTKPAQRDWVWLKSPCCRTHHRRHIHSHLSSRFCILYLFPSQELPKSSSSKVRCSNLILAHTHSTDRQDGDTNYNYGSNILHLILHIHLFARSCICSRLYP